MQPSLLEHAAALGTLVRLLGVSVDLMSRLENGQGTVRLDKALAVLDGLGLALLVVPKEHDWMRTATRTPDPGAQP